MFKISSIIQFLGFAKIEGAQKDGQRYGAYASIISQLQEKPNVKISKYSHVLKVKWLNVSNISNKNEWTFSSSGLAGQKPQS